MFASCYSYLMKLKRSQKGELLEKTLNAIGNAVIAISRHPARNSLSVYRAIRDFKDLQDASKRQLQSISRYAVRKKYITVRKSEDSAEIEVTEAGKKLMQRRALHSLKPKRQKTWDGKWRIVMFDVPNHSKKARDAFAATLKRLGFEHFQKSVFLCPYPCEEELEIVADYYDIADCVEVVIAERITHEDSFKRLFGLK